MNDFTDKIPDSLSYINSDTLLLIPSTQSQKSVLNYLPGAYSNTLFFRHAESLQLFDTFDFRLAQSNIFLLKNKDQFVLNDKTGENCIANRGLANKQYLFASDMTKKIRSTLEPLIDVRALYSKMDIRITTTAFRILNQDEKTIAFWFFMVLLLSHNNSTQRLKMLALDSIKGYGKDKKTFLSALKPQGLESINCRLLHYVIKHTGLADKALAEKTALQKNQPAWKAVQTILKSLLNTIQLNKEGIIKDIDTEFLHDYRVALRRTRAAISQLKNILPPGEVERFKVKFKNIQQRTNQLRDLDVYLLNRSEYEKQIPLPLRPGLEPYFDELGLQRAVELKKVQRFLGTAQYYKVLEQWRALLSKDWQRQEQLTLQNMPIKSLADQLMRKKLEQILKRGRQITPASPISDIHDVRIKCKNLRYLYEIFRSLYPNNLKTLIKQFKKFQDYLGRINDLSIQQEHIAEFLRHGEKSVRQNPQVIAALSGLSVVLKQNFDVLLSSFQEMFDEFSGKMEQHLNSNWDFR